MIKDLLKRTFFFGVYLKRRCRRIVRAVFTHEQRLFQTWNMDASRSSVGEASLLAAMYHVVEKGLTMPGRRLGFGQAAVSNLARKVIEFRKDYGESCSEYKHAVAVLAEYYKLHEQEQVELLLSTKVALEECLNGVGGLRLLNLE